MNSNPINYQDWDPVVFTKKQQNTQKKDNVQKPAGNKEMNRLIEEEIPKLNKMTREYALSIINARNAAGLSQKDLAQKMSVKIGVVRKDEKYQVMNFNMGCYKKLMRNLGVDPKTVINKK